jgi:hypothetical protein
VVEHAVGVVEVLFYYHRELQKDLEVASHLLRNLALSTHHRRYGVVHKGHNRLAKTTAGTNAGVSLYLFVIVMTAC